MTPEQRARIDEAVEQVRARLEAVVEAGAELVEVRVDARLRNLAPITIAFTAAIDEEGGR